MRGRPTHLASPGNQPDLGRKDCHATATGDCSQPPGRCSFTVVADRCSGDPTEVEEAADALRLSRSVTADEGRPSTGVERDLYRVAGSRFDDGLGGRSFQLAIILSLEQWASWLRVARPD
jgi:hypothetical protein